MSFTKTEFNNFRNDVENALNEVAKKYSLNIHAGNITHDEFDFTMQLKCKKIGCEKEKFEAYCSLYGFKKTDYLREFTLDNEKFQLIGFNLSASKNNCNIRNVKNGKIYLCNNKAINFEE